MGKDFYIVSRRWALAIPVAVLLVVVLSFLVLRAAERVIADSRTGELREAAAVTAAKLGALTVDGPLMGGALLAGITQPDLKRVVSGGLPDDDPAVDDWLAQFRAVFGAPNAFLTDGKGRIVAYSIDSGPSGTGNVIAYRPYFQQAMAGRSSVYVAVGTNSFSPGVFFATPITATAAPGSPALGVLVVKQSIAAIEALLADGSRTALLLSPQGVVFAANRDDWHFHVAGAVDAGRIAAIKNSRQLGNVFDAHDPVSLPFDPSAARALVDGKDLGIATAPVAWNDPGGAWRLVLVEDRDSWLPLASRIGILAAAVVVLGLLGLVVVMLLQVGADRRAEAGRVRKLSRAVEHSPIATIIADTRRIVQYTNPRLTEVTGYTDDEIDGHDITLLADASLEVRGGLEQTIAAGKVWDGELLSRRKDGSSYWAKWGIAPIRDADGAITHLVALIEDITERKSMERQITALNERLKVENLRLGTELDVSRKIQQMILPTDSELARIRDLDVATFMEPANEVGGDYYDILQHEDGRLRIGIGDVTGHGLESGVVMLMTQSVVRTLVTGDETNAVRLLDVLNRTIFDNIERMGSDKNLTLALLDYRPEPPEGMVGTKVAGHLRISGQHESLIVVRDGGVVELVDTVDLGLPIGLVQEVKEFVAEITVLLYPGDIVVLYTDGITEAADASDVLYGLERLCEVVSEHWQDNAAAIKAAVVADVRRHIGGQPLYDDLTLIVLKQN